MADTVSSQPINRSQLAKVFPTQELIRWAENLTADATVVLPDALIAAQLALAGVDALNTGVFGPKQPIPKGVRPSGFITVSEDGGGYVVGINEYQLFIAMQTYLRPSFRQQPPSATDAQNILANRVFAKR